MLKLVGLETNGSIADEVVLLDEKDRPTKWLLGLCALEIAVDVTLAIVLARTVFKK